MTNIIPGRAADGCRCSTPFSILFPAQMDTLPALDYVVGIGTPGLTVAVQIDCQPFLTTQVDAYGLWEVENPCPLEVGLHSITAYQYACGATREATSLFFVNPRANRSAILLTPAAGGWYTNPLSAAGTGEPGAKIEISILGTTISQSTTVDAAGNWSMTFAQSLPAGQYTMRLVSLDAQGALTGFVLRRFEMA